MATCEFLDASPDAFREHMYDLVSQISDCVYTEIQSAVRSADKDNAEDVATWKKNLNIDITTMDRQADWGDDAVKMAIHDYVSGELSVLYLRGGDLPDPDKTSKLMNVLKNKLYGTGYVQTSGDASAEVGGDGALGTAADEAWSARTNELADWRSHTATTFKTKFLDNAGLVIKKQREELNTLAHFVDLNLGTVKRARKDFDSIAHGGLAAAQDMCGTCGQGADGNATNGDDQLTAGASLGLIAGATALGAAMATGNLQVALGITSGVATYYQNLVGSDETLEEWTTFGAVNWKELVGKIADAASEVESSLDDSYKSMSGAINRRIGEVAADKERMYVVKLG